MHSHMLHVLQVKTTLTVQPYAYNACKKDIMYIKLDDNQVI